MGKIGVRFNFLRNCLLSRCNEVDSEFSENRSHSVSRHISSSGSAEKLARRSSQIEDTKHFLKRASFLLVFLSLISCNRYWYKPMGYLFNDAPKEGSPGFKLGWMHGCESGLSTQFGGAIYESFYSWKRDPDIASSEPNIEKIRRRYKKELKGVDWNNKFDVKKNLSDYNTIFWNAHYYCRQMIIGLLISADMKPPVADEERFNPMAHSVGNVWKITGRGDTRIGTGLW